MRVALLEDDTHVGQLLSLWLEEAGYDCTLFSTGEAIQRALSRESYDLLILDWVLPDTSGDKVLQWVRERLDWRVPVIFVTALDDEENIVQGLNLGADDYIVKPVRYAEFLARVRAVMRRFTAASEKDGKLEFPPFQFDLNSRLLTSQGQVLDLTQMEFELALFLFRNAGRLLSRGHLLETVWGTHSDISSRTVDTHISRVRNKLGLVPENGWKLTAIYNHGYRLERVQPLAAVS